jgi:nitrous oxide reductase
MKKGMKTGIAAVLLAAAMGFGGPAAAITLGSCGAANQGEVKSFAYYHMNGRLSRYYEFTCYGNQWEMTFYLVCDAQGECINLT